MAKIIETIYYDSCEAPVSQVMRTFSSYRAAQQAFNQLMRSAQMLEDGFSSTGKPDEFTVVRGGVKYIYSISQK